MKIITENTMKNEALIEELMTLVFHEVGKTTNETSAYGFSKYLHTAIDEKIAERTLLRYYNGYILKKTNEKTRPNTYNLDVLSSYLGYTNFYAFSIREESLQKKKAFRFPKKTRIIGASLVVGCLGYFGYTNTKKECMIWVDNARYEAIACSERTDLHAVAKDVYLLKHLKRIVPDSTYPFFTMDGKENLWYEKNTSGDLEYFTSYGQHPITGKTLKKITPYMIKKHLWSTYNN